MFQLLYFRFSQQPNEVPERLNLILSSRRGCGRVHNGTLRTVQAGTREHPSDARRMLGARERRKRRRNERL